MEEHHQGVWLLALVVEGSNLLVDLFDVLDVARHVLVASAPAHAALPPLTLASDDRAHARASVAAASLFACSSSPKVVEIDCEADRSEMRVRPP